MLSVFIAIAVLCIPALTEGKRFQNLEISEILLC